MKKNILAFCSCSLFALMVACGDNNTQSVAKQNTTPTDTIKIEQVVVLSDNPDYQKGLKLVAQNDCFTCHDIDKKLTGPSYREVADKYTEKDIPVLASTIIKGSKGKWSTVPMTLHPTLSNADAEQMVKYILLLKTPKK